MKFVLTFLFALLCVNTFAQRLTLYEVVDGVKMEYWYHEFFDTLKTKPITFLNANVRPVDQYGAITKNELHIIDTETSKVLKRIEKINEEDVFLYIKYSENYVGLVCYNNKRRPGMHITQIVDLHSFEKILVEYNWESDIFFIDGDVLIDGKSIKK